MKKNKSSISPQIQAEAMKIANANQKPGQSKAQTKLIAQGIEKGIAQYKKQQKEKARQADKQKKRHSKTKQEQQAVSLPNDETSSPVPSTHNAYLPWGLLGISWFLFILYGINSM